MNQLDHAFEDTQKDKSVLGINGAHGLPHAVTTRVLQGIPDVQRSRNGRSSFCYPQQAVTFSQDFVLILTGLAAVQDHALVLVGEDEQYIFVHVLADEMVRRHR